MVINLHSIDKYKPAASRWLARISIGAQPHSGAVWSQYKSEFLQNVHLTNGKCVDCQSGKRAFCFNKDNLLRQTISNFTNKDANSFSFTRQQNIIILFFFSRRVLNCTVTPSHWHPVKCLHENWSQGGKYCLAVCKAQGSVT